MKKILILTFALILTAVLTGCNTAGIPAASPYNPNIFSPNANNVNFNDRNLTTNFMTDNPAQAMPNISANAGG